jgi:hypothetical protein
MAHGGGDRQVAEQEVADAVAAQGRPLPDAGVAAGADTTQAQQADKEKQVWEPSPEAAPAAEDTTPDAASAVETPLTEAVLGDAPAPEAETGPAPTPEPEEAPGAVETPSQETDQ